MTFATEFSDFPATDIPVVLQSAEWRDASWRNDSGPFFVHETSGVGVFVNPRDPAEREFPELMARFAVVAMVHDAQHGWQHSGDADTLAGFEDEGELIAALPGLILPRALAHEFAGICEDVLSDDMATIRERNATAEYRDTGACATHDFCDANELMSTAFESVTGRPIIADDGIPDADIDLWNQAWAIARRERLTA